MELGLASKKIRRQEVPPAYVHFKEESSSLG
jgi:hypothetical protein